MLKLALPLLPLPFFSSQLSRAGMLNGFFDGAEHGAAYWRDEVGIFLGSPHKIADHRS